MIAEAGDVFIIVDVIDGGWALHSKDTRQAQPQFGKPVRQCQLRQLRGQRTSYGPGGGDDDFRTFVECGT